MRERKLPQSSPLESPCEAPADPHYLGYFDCFNEGRYYEAHDVLEVLWLRVRREEDGDFYKALIQVAGAFVHLGKGRLAPAVSLLRTARAHLARYPARHCGVDAAGLRDQAAAWIEAIEDRKANPLAMARPRLTLMGR